MIRTALEQIYTLSPISAKRVNNKTLPDDRESWGGDGINKAANMHVPNLQVWLAKQAWTGEGSIWVRQSKLCKCHECVLLADGESINVVDNRKEEEEKHQCNMVTLKEAHISRKNNNKAQTTLQINVSGGKEKLSCWPNGCVRSSFWRQQNS